MTMDTTDWPAVLAFDELWEGDMVGVSVGDQSVLLMNVDGELRAYENRCPHQAWALDQGDFDGRELVCNKHNWVFDALTGKGVNPDDCALTAVPVAVDDDGMIRVGRT
jgi:toluene monooxygenase system ferredoxin subunit